MKGIRIELSGTGKCPAAMGTAIFNLRENCLYLYARGLPEPSYFGSDEITRQAFDAYEVWLVEKDSKRLISAGWLRKAGHSMYHLFFRCSQLTEYSGIQVTVQDRLGSISPTMVVVLEGEADLAEETWIDFSSDPAFRGGDIEQGIT